MRSDAATVAGYLDGLPADRRADMARVRDLVRASLPPGYVETMRWGMITWEVPLAVSRPTYNGQPLMYAALASQKRHMALYLCGANCVPGQRGRLEAGFRAEGKRLDFGKACLRFRRAGDLAEAAVAQTVAAVAVADFVRAAAR